MNDLSELVKPLVWGAGQKYGDAQSWLSFNKEGRFCYGVDLAGIFYIQTPDREEEGFLTLDAARAAAHADYAARVLASIDTDKITALISPIAEFLPDAVAAAEKAMTRYPQPNYVISKWAEETGEVTKALIHCAENRETWGNLRGEIVQSLAMLHRLMIEGDQMHGLPALVSLRDAK